jgi:hypothetical protein
MASKLKNGLKRIFNSAGKGLSMCYKTAILQAIEDLKDHHAHGSSLAAIKKHVEASLTDGGKVWKDAVFLRTIKGMVERGELIQTEDHYKASVKLQQQRAGEIRDHLEREKAKKHVTPKSPESKKVVPKFKPALVKKKLLDSKVITLVKPGRKTEKMTLDEKEKAKSPGSDDRKPRAAKKTEHDKVKIIPHKIVAKRGIKDPMKA